MEYRIEESYAPGPDENVSKTSIAYFLSFSPKEVALFQDSIADILDDLDIPTASAIYRMDGITLEQYVSTYPHGVFQILKINDYSKKMKIPVVSPSAASGRKTTYIDCCAQVIFMGFDFEDPFTIVKMDNYERSFSKWGRAIYSE